MRLCVNHSSALISDELFKVNIFVYSPTSEEEAWFKTRNQMRLTLRRNQFRTSSTGGVNQLDVNSILYLRQLEDELLSDPWGKIQKAIEAT